MNQQNIFDDFQNLQNFRPDGRKKSESRNFIPRLGFDPLSEGSCHLKMGITEVVCQIRGPHEKKNQDKNKFINVFYSVAPFSGIERKAVSKFDKESSEFAENLRLSFEKLIFTETLQKSEIDIIITILQGDGSTKAAIFNCITLALLDAGIGMKDFLVGSTVGLSNSEPFVDITYEEQRQMNAEIVISYMPRQQKIDFISLKCSKINVQDLENMKQSAVQACENIYQQMRQHLIQSSLKKLLCSR
ncbi:Ribosomal protein S5 domain 2-type fold [Pseudocohnilembus persalinus]|uniref:Ribosomal protein S5 domain 2-type fold n=1 Tax=Pseudocohnilembus persalinus TaxID=266149 RepID=A0A0V0QW78_PSEPJ|nr:Ribosomal protein S5 domain 2-type fold [Pseudocohnilembus persalinus]|eukprot:KRX06503.1 Ribosomal protein S5 domain 2-type fold [Pseudocohnilembus persalinus]